MIPRDLRSYPQLAAAKNFLSPQPASACRSYRLAAGGNTGLGISEDNKSSACPQAKWNHRHFGANPTQHKDTTGNGSFASLRHDGKRAGLRGDGRGAPLRSLVLGTVAR